MITGNDIINIAALTTGALVLKSVFSSLRQYDFKDKTVLINEEAALRNNEALH
jgi:hypothetical protein